MASSQFTRPGRMGREGDVGCGRQNKGEGLEKRKREMRSFQEDIGGRRGDGGGMGKLM